MKRSIAGLAAGFILPMGAATAAEAAMVSELLDKPLRNERVLYLIVKDEERFQTFPVRALGEWSTYTCQLARG